MVLVILGAGYYLYKRNYFSKINAEFDYTPDGVGIIAQGQELHDCKLTLTNEFTTELPVLRPEQRVSISKFEFKQWNKVGLEAMKDLGPTIEFHLRCSEGKMDAAQSNRYAAAEKEAKGESESGEVTESNK